MRSKSVVWIPFLLVGSMIYWTLAFGFGGMSLMTFALFQECTDASDAAPASTIRDSYQSITVNIADIPVDDSAGAEQDVAPITVDLVSNSELNRAVESGQGARSGSQRPYEGPGQTAF